MGDRMQGSADPPAKSLRTPRAAGAAGILAALMLGGAMVLVRLAFPDRPLDAAEYLADTSSHRALRVALVLLPYGGIFFLWFMGALRDSIGAREDRFFATVFFGAGLLYVAMLLVFGATAGAYLDTIEEMKAAGQPGNLHHFGRYLTFTLLAEYAPRMAAVFTLTATTIATRLGIFPRWLSALGYLAGLVLLLVVRTVVWTEMLFPVWVLAVGCFLLGAPPAGNGVRLTAKIPNP
ncbi:hypothetical protein ACFSKW_29785 [Nonomuraea mangrovi]|uniref:DUF4386 family protein n=1 Tax=Nonomuraea mangrovi TaxID=2316207 RepID=A0ABW4T5F1_9ACTN